MAESWPIGTGEPDQTPPPHHPMIRPVRQGRELLDQIASTCPEPGSLAIWWLGQSGFLVKSTSMTLVIDPYLSESLTIKYSKTDRPHIRMTSAPCRGAELRGVDLILASHKHSDHLDPETISELLAASPQCRLGIPAALLDHALSLGVSAERLCGLDAGETVTLGDHVAIRAVPSAHEGLDVDAMGRHLYLGFVIEVDGLRLYHSGDTVAFDSLEGWLGKEPFDVMFLPINGRDPARGVPGNMTVAEAVALAARVRPRFLVPHHYDMFTFNTVPVDDFRAMALRLPPGVEPRILRCGERWEVHR